LLPPIIDGLTKKGREDVLVIAGGIVPEDDIPALQQMGVKAVFGPGTSTQDIIRFIQKEATRSSAL
jgi:methylmalonyl-CoA mutase C-terminal domain/subunit